MNRLKEVIVLTAAYYGRDLSDHVLKMYCEDLADLNQDQVILAYNQWRKSPRNRQMPLPAEIRGLIRPEISADDEAKEAAARIFAAVPKFGWCNQQQAREYIGELGWRVVDMQGGWVYLCETLKPSMVPTLQAQCRELAKTVQIKNINGLDNIAPGLPGKFGEMVGVLGESRDLKKLIE